MRGILLFLCLLPRICWPQSSSEATAPGSQCCQCSTQVEQNDSGAVLCLSEKQMRSHVAHVVPLKLGEPHAAARGTLVLRVRFESDGTVACLKAISGHPLVIASAMEVVPKWRFRAVQKKDKKYGGCGVIRVKYRLSDSEQETTVQ